MVVVKEAVVGLAAVVVEIVTGGNLLTHGRRVEEDGLVFKPICHVVIFYYLRRMNSLA